MPDGLSHPTHKEIFECLDREPRKSFFLFAGAGSGKTRALVEVLKLFRFKYSTSFRLHRCQLAVITYTNAACDEIERRLEHDRTFSVSTIHSFVWQLIKPYQADIRLWLRPRLEQEIAELEEEQRRGRAGTKAAIDRPRKIRSKRARLDRLDSIRRFSYNPNGENIGRDSLQHAEVIGLMSSFLRESSLMRKILIRKFPILLIDESQDTNKDLIEALFAIQAEHSNMFCLGLFGDTMQRIYFDGLPTLGQGLPPDWAKPSLPLNHRCPERVVRLINKVRRDVDDHKQEATKAEQQGVVRLFLLETGAAMDRPKLEEAVCATMARITSDTDWGLPNNGVKVLTLEHHMAAKRGGFSSFFEPLYSVDKLKNGVLDGSLSGVTFFISHILPIVRGKRKSDEFAVASTVREYCSFLTRVWLRETEDPRAELSRANTAVQDLWALWGEGRDPSLLEILKEVYRSGLFQVPDVLVPIAKRTDEEVRAISEPQEPDEDADAVIDAWDRALSVSFSVFEKYVTYVSDESPFGTHQGVKGLEFPRVLVILDDEEARGFQFSYEKLFGAKEATPADRKNAAEGRETSVDRTRRLFYVTCSRAEKSLAIIAYTSNPVSVRQHVLREGWFEESEIMDGNDLQSALS